MKEYKDLTADDDAVAGLFTAGPIDEKDFFEWEALVMGPEGTPYEGGVFPARLKFVSNQLGARQSPCAR